MWNIIIIIKIINLDKFLQKGSKVKGHQYCTHRTPPCFAHFINIIIIIVYLAPACLLELYYCEILSTNEKHINKYPPSCHLISRHRRAQSPHRHPLRRLFHPRSHRHHHLHLHRSNIIRLIIQLHQRD